ncbi:MAG TPA: molecular chaperone DnaJ [Phenylobacterium sp.]
MQFVALGALALLLLVWASGGRNIFLRREWRITSGAFAIAAFAGAGYSALRESWIAAMALLILGLWLAVSARKSGLGAAPRKPPPATPRSDRMSLKEARSVLGVEADATAEDIRAAHKRLMRMAHPDKGGTSGLAAQLNAARDRLLEG